MYLYVLMSVDRFLAVRHAFWHVKYMTTGNCVKITFIFIAIVLAKAGVLIFWNDYKTNCAYFEMLPKTLIIIYQVESGFIFIFHHSYDPEYTDIQNNQENVETRQRSVVPPLE